MTRSSTPSKRPQTRTTPPSPVNASMRACVSGVPRGDSRSRGRPSIAVASMARASTSAFITMPGPPPAGVSSTVRCLSVANARISTTSSDQVPAIRALPARLKPNGPGNISGKMESTEARHILLFLSREGRRLNHDPPSRDIDTWNITFIERDQFGLAAGRKPHLDQIASAEIMHGENGAERFAGLVDDRKPDQIGVIELVCLGKRGQALARHIKFQVRQFLRGIAIANTGKRRNKMIFGRPQRFDFQNAAVLGLQRSISGDRFGLG